VEKRGRRILPRPGKSKRKKRILRKIFHETEILQADFFKNERNTLLFIKIFILII